MDETIIIIYIGNQYWDKIKDTFFDPAICLLHYNDPVVAKQDMYKHKADIVLCENDTDWIKGIQFFILQQEALNKHHMIFFLISNYFSKTTLRAALEAGIPDCFHSNLNLELFFDKYLFIRSLKRTADNKTVKVYTPSIPKRIFDISLASLLLTLSFPIVLPLALFMQYEANEKIIKTRQMLGTGLNIFKSYHISKAKYAEQKPKNLIWRFAHKSQIDRLPELINVIKGDISFTGLRPLQARESELLNTYDWKKRVSCPVGLAETKDVNINLPSNYTGKASFLPFTLKQFFKGLPNFINTAK